MACAIPSGLQSRSIAAATAAVASPLVRLTDVLTILPGTLPEPELARRLADTDGAVTFADAASAETYGVVDEIAGRVLAAGGQVLGVRRDEVPGGGDLAAILRFAV